MSRRILREDPTDPVRVARENRTPSPRTSQVQWSKMVESLPNLDTIVSKCYQIGLTLDNKQQAETFCSALAFLGHLKAEREDLRVL